MFFISDDNRFSLDDNKDNMNNRKNGRNCGMSRSDIQQRQQDYCCQLVNYALFLEDDRDNKITVAN